MSSFIAPRLGHVLPSAARRVEPSVVVPWLTTTPKPVPASSCAYCEALISHTVTIRDGCPGEPRTIGAPGAIALVLPTSASVCAPWVTTTLANPASAESLAKRARSAPRGTRLTSRAIV